MMKKKKKVFKKLLQRREDKFIYLHIRKYFQLKVTTAYIKGGETDRKKSM